MPRPLRFAVPLLLLVVALSLAFGVVWATEIASLSGSADAVRWVPTSTRNGHVLTVAIPGGEVARSEFGAGEMLVFPLFDRSGNRLADGVYRWELTLVPTLDAATLALLEEARRRGDTTLVGHLRAEGRLPAVAAQSGTFALVDGDLVTGGRDEDGDDDAGAAPPSATAPVPPREDTPAAPVARDQVISDDLIVLGSECVGFDCASGETFGSDTIRLKENNLRIHFDDTSTGSGFPSRDWRIQANDEASGGDNKFSIQDATGSLVPFTLEAGAPNHSLFVDSVGRVGLGTSTPVLDLHVKASDTPAIRLEQTAGGGFGAQTWDVAGNEANFFVRDVTEGSRLPLRIRPGAPTSALDINADGQLGIGTSTADAPIHIERDGTSENAGFLLQNSGGTVPSLWFFQVQSANGAFVATPNGSGTNAPLKIFTGAPENSITIGQNGGGTSPRVGVHRVSSVTHPLHVGTDATNGNGAHVTAAGVWTDGSSRVGKTDLADLEETDALAAVANLHPVRYKGKQDATREEYLGFIAEDVPDLVAMNGRNGLSPMDIVAALTKVVQAHQREKEELKARVAELEAAVRALEARPFEAGSPPGLRTE